MRHLLNACTILSIITFPARIECGFGDAFGLITKVQTECEYDSLTIGTKLSDQFNIYDEATEHDVRLHNDYLVSNLAFAQWIDGGVGGGGLTATDQFSALLRKQAGWAEPVQQPGSGAYWALENKWIYLLGDTTLRQIWANFVAPAHGIDVEQSAKNWTQEHCQRQTPHRTDHSTGQHFPEEGWAGRCGKNEYTCHLPGYGPHGKITYDWKHFPLEDYDRWLLGPEGLWSNDSSIVRPDVVVIQTGLHTCMHAIHSPQAEINETMIASHDKQVVRFIRLLKKAIARPRDDGRPATTVIFSLSGRVLAGDRRSDECTWAFNRKLAMAAHGAGFPVFEREEIEHRILFKSENSPGYAKIVKAETYHLHKNTEFHMPAPIPQIVATALLEMITCLARNGTKKTEFPPYNSVLATIKWIPK